MLPPLLSILRVIVPVAILMSQPMRGWAQTDTAFAARAAQYQSWLSATLSIAMPQVESWQKRGATTVVSLRMDNAGAWNAFRHHYQARYGRSAAEWLHEKAAFITEFPRNELSLAIRTANGSYAAGVLFDLAAGYQVEEEAAKSFLPPPAPLVDELGPIEETISIPLDQLPRWAREPSRAVVCARQRIKSDLERYYATRGSWLWRARYEFTRQHSGYLELEVSNLSKEILYDLLFSPFEFIVISMHFEVQGDSLLIRHRIQGKYSSALAFIPPTRDAYKDMEPQFRDYLTRYLGITTGRIRMAVRATP